MYIAYRVENKHTQEYYYGVCTEHTYRYNATTPYHGSSTYVLEAIATHGVENFSRAVVSIAETPEEAEWIERQMITDRAIADPLCYNKQKSRGFARACRTMQTPEMRERMREQVTAYHRTPEKVREREKKAARKAARKAADIADRCADICLQLHLKRKEAEREKMLALWARHRGDNPTKYALKDRSDFIQSNYRAVEEFRSVL